MKRASSRLLVVLAALAAAGSLASCDLPGHSANNGLQRVSNGIP